ncbi:YhhN family [Popillia japonica]|uniref:lysoplasmalogenase n=1 Tax=Popillia japonica TaxID=7064 RepID=A0AAW1HUJ6_POPJA
MTSATEVVKSAGPKLVPFFKTVAIYFVIFMPHDQPSIVGAIIKILPIISLMIFVYLYGRDQADEYKWFSRRILTGLIFSSIGDVCLVWSKDYFQFGMVSFAIGHINYITAFGFKPLVFRVGLVGYILTLICKY